MPHLSKRKLDAKTERLLNSALFSLFSNLKSSQAERLIRTLLTDTERLMLAKRVGASFLISENVPQNKISESLKLSEETVHKFILIINAGDKSTWEFILGKLKRWQEFSILREALKEAGTYALKKFSRGMAGKI